MDVDAAQAQWAGPSNTKRKDKPDVTCYNCGKTGHFKKDYRGPKRDWKPVPEKEVATITKGVKITEVAAISYAPDGSGRAESPKEESEWEIDEAGEIAPPAHI
jgi:hypothetical protein